MGKFNAAKMSGSGDVAFQNNYNYLIDLLDNGYLAEGIVGGKRVRVDVNPRDGFRMNIDNTDVFYIDSTGDAVFSGNVTIDGGENGKIIITPTVGLQMLNAAGVQIGGTAIIETILMSIAGALTNDATDPAMWVIPGEVTIDAVTYTGILLYLRDWSASVPFLKIACRKTSSTTRISYIEMSSNNWIKMFENSSTGENSVTLYSGGYNYQSAEISANSKTGASTKFKMPLWAGYAILGIDTTGPYYIKGDDVSPTYFA
jgi:hypothetical protein